MKEHDIDEYHNDFLNNMVEYNIDMNKNHFVVFLRFNLFDDIGSINNER